MAKQEAEGCVATAGGPIVDVSDKTDRLTPTKEPALMRVTVGKKAPDFEASAFVDGGFKNIKLSDYAGKWVFLCFYPGDFTFV